MSATDLKALASEELPDASQGEFMTVPTPTDMPEEAPEFACEVCGKELHYGGRGRKPKFCEEHKKGGASKIGSTPRRSSGKDVDAAVAALDSWYSMLTMGLFMSGARQSSNLLAESVAGVDGKPGLNASNRSYLEQTPALAKRIAEMGKTSAMAGFFSAQALTLIPVAVLAAGELSEKWGRSKESDPNDFDENLPGMVGGVPVG